MSTNVISVNVNLWEQLPRLEKEFPDPQKRKNEASILSHKWWTIRRYDEHNLDAFNYPISCCLFHERYGRAYSNKESVRAMTGLMVDVDSPQKISSAEFLSRFDDYNYIIFITINDMKIKDGKPPCDRYRLFLMYERPVKLDTMEQKDNYQKQVELFFKKSPLCKDMDIDPTASGISRFYYPGKGMMYHSGKTFFSYDMLPTLPPIPKPKPYKADPLDVYRNQIIPTSILGKIQEMRGSSGGMDGNRSSLACIIAGMCKKCELSREAKLRVLDMCIAKGIDKVTIKSFKQYSGL